MTRRKLSFTENPLAFPQTPIHRLASNIQTYLHFPDPTPLYVLMGTLVANYAQGRPVWLMLIGPPSCGKSELLNSLLSLPRIKEGGSITGVGALLSGSRKKDRNSSSTGGLLHEIGDRGALVIKEFTSILSLPSDTMRQVLGAFREVYDGRYTRSVGSDGGNDQHWAGKLAVLTGCTEAIDHHHQLVSDMGERFVFYRYEQSDGWAETFKALGVTNTESLSANLQAQVLEFAEEIGLHWDVPPELPELDTADKNRIIAFSQFSSHGRSAVIRDTYTKEIVQASIGEYPIRLALALSQLLRAMRYIGVGKDDCWAIIRKIAFDSIPGSRRLTLMSLLAGNNSTAQISDSIRVSQTTVRRSLEELQVHNLVERADPSSWQVTEWASKRLTEACNGAGLSGLKLIRE